MNGELRPYHNNSSVYFDVAKMSWIMELVVAGKRQRRTFSSRKYGDRRAKSMAEAALIDLQKGGLDESPDQFFKRWSGSTASLRAYVRRLYVKLQQARGSKKR